MKELEGRAGWWVGGILPLVLFLAGCEGTYRSFGRLQRDNGEPGSSEIDDAGGGGDGPSTDGDVTDAGQVAIQLLGLGDACTDASECESRQCADGVCCDSPCDGLCATCAAPGSEGTCSPAPSDVACDALSCPAATECRGRDETALALNCDGIGACRESVECPPLNAAAGTACQEGAGACDGDGACAVPGKASLGEACSADAECAEGHCVVDAIGAGICCDAACDGVCQQCSAEGHCEEVPPAGDSACPPLSCDASTECRIVTAPAAGACSGLGQCAQCQVLEQPAGTDCGADGDCDASGTCRPNATPPTVVANSLRAGAFIDLDRINLLFTAATDDRTPVGQLEYAAFHALTDTFPATAAQIVSAATSGSINTLRGFAPGAQLEALVLPERAHQHFVVVVVRDGSGNVAAYTPAPITFQDPPSCTVASDCIDNQCLTLFADSDGDCRGDPNATIRRCSAPTLSASSCPAPRPSSFAGVTVGTVRYVNNSFDCLDSNVLVFRNQPRFFANAFAVPSGSPPGAFAEGFDYNCSGETETDYPSAPSASSLPECVTMGNTCGPAGSGAFYLDSQNPAACGAVIGAASSCQFINEFNTTSCTRNFTSALKACH